jgi:hypothetical protein
MEAEKVSEKFDCNFMLTRLVAREDFIAFSRRESFIWYGTVLRMISTVKMEEIRTSVTLAITYKNIRCHNPEDHNLHLRMLQIVQLQHFFLSLFVSGKLQYQTTFGLSVALRAVTVCCSM